MTTFRVWAPRPERVELVIANGIDGSGGQRTIHRMERDAGGWWQAEVEAPRTGVDYGFLVDSAGPFPDPRSPSQPNGVHALSRTVDHRSFTWSDATWQAPRLDEAVIYEVHVGTFTPAGTFDGVADRLGDLAELGITHVELMPVVEFPGERGWGYDGVDLFAPHHAYGGPDGLKRLIDACHAHGLAVLVDVVWNHLGPDGNYLTHFGPYFSDRYGTPWGEAVNFDGPGSDEVRAFVLDNARLWLEDYHADGLRIDAVHEIFDRSAVHILEAVAVSVHALGERLGRNLVATAESDLNDPRLVRDIDLGGYGLDAQWNDDYRHAIHVALTGEADAYHAQYSGIEDVAAALRRVFVFDGRYSPFRGRTHGRPVDDLEAIRFVGFLQNHDQVGNRAAGERIGHLVPIDAAKVGAALVLLGPFVPLLFAGEEWAASAPFQYFTDHQDKALGAAIRDGRRREFAAFLQEGPEVPDPQAAETFERSRLDWSERSAEPHASMLAWYRQLIAFRAAHPQLRDGSRPDVQHHAAARWLVAGQGNLQLVANMRAESQAIPLGGSGPWQITLASSEVAVLDADGVRLPGWSMVVVEPAI